MLVIRSIIIALCLFIILFGCNQGGEKLFTMEVEADFTIPPGLNTFDTHYFIVRQVPTRIRSYIGAVNDPSTIRIYPSRADLTSLFSNIDFSIVREISIWAISSTDRTIKEEIFYQNRIELKEQKQLKLFSSLSEVKDILMNDHFDLEIRMNFRTFTPTEIDTRLTMNFIANGAE